MTGNDRKIKDQHGKEVIGVKKNLVFYEGRGSKARRTNWVIHEYHSTKASAYKVLFNLLFYSNYLKTY